MNPNDRKKLIVALSLFGIIAVSYAFEGKGPITKTIVGICGAAWLLTIFILKPKKN